MIFNGATPEAISREPGVPTTITAEPNPTEAIVELTTHKSYEGSKLAVVDGYGKTVYATTLSGISTSLDLSDLTPGLYVARILKPDGTIATIRIVKK